MTTIDLIQTIMSGFGIVGSIIVGYFVFKASDRASARTEAQQRTANATDGFDKLTTQQANELARAYSRAESAEASASSARDAAEEAQTIAEKCQLQQVQLAAYVRELYEWAEQPCPHIHPPPQPPLRLARL